MDSPIKEAAAKMNQQTAWFRRAVIYHILIDRFAGMPEQNLKYWDKPQFLGGNLSGITDKLDYLRALGINALWLSPFCNSPDYHGYHVTDYFALNPRFGTPADLNELIFAAHERGIGIIADFVPNHCHDSHPFFREALDNPGSRCRNWFYFDQNGDYLKYFGLGYLPKINLDNAGARAHLIESALYWLDKGIDGFRIDHLIGLSGGFLKELRRQVRTRFPRAVLIGEVLLGKADLKYHYDTIQIPHKRFRRHFFSLTRVLKDYYGLVDGVLDYPFQFLMRDYAAGRLSPAALKARLKKHFAIFPPDYLLTLFLDNHDQNRFLAECNGSRQKYLETVKLLFDTAKQYALPVIIYYGSETGMGQLGRINPAYPYSDLLARRFMNWDRDYWDREIFGAYKELIQAYLA